MRAILIETYQQSAQFRKPVTFKIKETYPLPPYSTVIGAIHAMCGFVNYVDMDVSIQGISDCTCFDFATEYAFKPATPFEAGRHQLSYPGLDPKGRERDCGVTVSPAQIETIHGLKLLLHVVVKDDFMFDRVLDGIKNPAVIPSLGRAEDVMKITRVQEVALTEDMRLSSSGGYDKYVPCVNADFLVDGTVFRLNKSYVLDNGRRRWTNVVNVMFVNREQPINHNLFDQQGNPVFLA